MMIFPQFYMSVYIYILRYACMMYLYDICGVYMYICMIYKLYML